MPLSDDWVKWIKTYKFPADVKVYRMNGQLVYLIAGPKITEETNYLYLSDRDEQLVNGVRLDKLESEEAVHKAIANIVLKIQIDLRQPKEYKTYRINGELQIVRP